MFRDGWFYPGDAGFMTGPGALKLLGRAGDLINIGGQKFMPEHFEERLRHMIPVEDFCVVGLTDAEEVERLCVAVVLNNSANLEEIRDAIALIIPAHLGAFLLVKVPQIPTTPTGKPQRTKLKALISELQVSA